MSDPREMVHEISTLLGTLSQALGRPSEEVARLIEQGAVDLSLETDDSGQPFVFVAHGEAPDRVVARVYRDRILHLGRTPEGSAGTPSGSGDTAADP